MRRRAFTLIELLTVMAISAILLGLIIIPVFQSFNLTRAAQAFAEAQDRARILSEKIAKEIGNSFSVRSTALVPASLNGVPTRILGGTQIVSIPNGPQANAGLIEVALASTMIDLVSPAEGDQHELDAGVFTNSEGFQDPTVNSPHGQPVLPVGPGATMTRYFVGLRDPFLGYNNPYDGFLMARGGGRDNLFVLYRAEIQPFVKRAGVGTNGDVSARWRPNLLYFESDALTDTKIEFTLPATDPVTRDDDTDKAGKQILGLDDPRFMTAELAADGTVIQNDHNARIYHWLGQSAPWADDVWDSTGGSKHGAVIQTEVSRYDMIQPIYDLRTRLIERIDGVPRIVPLIQFRPERISNEPANGNLAVRPGEESQTSDAAGSDVYTTQYGQWAAFIVRTYPRGWDTAASRNEYEVGLASDRSGESGYSPGFSIYAYDPEESPTNDNIEYLKNNELFDVNMYVRMAALKINAKDPAYPFTAAVNAANSRSGWLSIDRWNRIFTPYTVDAARGRIAASFGIWEVGNATLVPPADNNLPTAATSDTPTPTTPANFVQTSANFYDYTGINDRYNFVYKNFPVLQPGNVHRFIDLRWLPNSDGTLSPLCPTKFSGLATGFVVNTLDGGNRNRVQIVPGSEIVTGPDQLNGPHIGSPIRYSRVTTGEPGPNQYKINYADQSEPTKKVGSTEVIDYSVLGVDVTGFNPRVYDRTNFVSAVIQPRNKVGYLQLNSDSNAYLPSGSISVSYRFQFTGKQTAAIDGGGRTNVDAFAVEYDSRELISVLLTIRNYPQSSVPNPQTVTLKSTAKVRNYTR